MLDFVYSAAATRVVFVAGGLGRIADEVEAAVLTRELPQPGVVAHPVSDEVAEPGLTQAAVVI